MTNASATVECADCYDSGVGLEDAQLERVNAYRKPDGTYLCARHARKRRADLITELVALQDFQMEHLQRERDRSTV